MAKEQEEADKVEEKGSKTPPKRKGRPPLSRSPPRREMQSLSPFEPHKRGRPPLSRSPPTREILSLSPFVPCKRGRPPFSRSPPRREIQSLSPSKPRKKRGRPRKQTPESPQPLVNLHCHLELAVAEYDRFGFLFEPGSLVEKSSLSLVETDSEQNADIGVSDERNGDEDHQELPISNFQDATNGWELSLVEGVKVDGEAEKPKSPAITGVELIDQMVEDGTALISPPPINVVADDQNIPSHFEDTLATVGDPVNSVEQQDARDLPFVKRSPVWQYIELMDIFEKFPQRPHFRPLVDYSEETREGVAIAKMLHFVSLAEDISNLTGPTSRESVKWIAGKLAEFEELGFDVETAQARLSEWLAVRAEVKELEAMWCRVDFHATWSFNRALEIGGKISEIDKRVEVLENRRAALMSKSAGIDFKISELQVEVARTKQAGS